MKCASSSFCTEYLSMRQSSAGTAESDWTMERTQEQPSFPHTIIELLHDLTTTKDLEAVEHPLYVLAIISRAEYWQRLWIL
jgi:hypothetical protein